MRVIKADLQMLTRRILLIGFVGENERTQVRIDAGAVFAEYPDSFPALVIKPPVGNTYPVVVSIEGNDVVWEVLNTDLTFDGEGELQLMFVVDDVVVKTVIGTFKVNRSIIVPGTTPTPVESWVQQATLKLGDVDRAINSLEQSDATVEGLPAGSAPTVDLVDFEGHKRFEFGIPKGDKGDTYELTQADREEIAEIAEENFTTEVKWYRDDAVAAKNRSEEILTAVSGSTAQAASSAAEAGRQAQAAALSAQAASSSATAADGSARTASEKASEASASAQNASGSASTATQKAAAAAQSATNAAQSATNAHASELAAKDSETNAKASETNAASSASSALASKNAAAVSATNSHTSETNAAGSASLASEKATLATNKANEASQSATNAANSASAAAGSATNAAQSAQAAQDVLDSIPEDYTELTEQVAENTEALKTKAEIDGYYSDMTVGNSEQLVSTVTSEDQTPYNFRTSGGTMDIGDQEQLEKIVGGTVCWNQLVTFKTGNHDSYDVTYEQKADGSVVVNGTATGPSYINLGATLHGIDGHKILIIGCPSGGSGSTYYLRDGYIAGKYDIGSGLIVAKANDNLIPQLVVASGVTMSNVVFKPQFFDLTQMFGPTIADYIYNLEQATAGAGVAWFKKLFPKPYYAYNAGELMSVKAVSHDMVGFNLFDESLTGQIAGSYRKVSFPAGLLGKCYMSLIEKDTSVTLPSNMACGFVRDDYDGSTLLVSDDFRWIMSNNNIRANRSNTNGGVAASDGNKLLDAMLVYPNTEAAWNLFKQRYSICINLSWDGERDGEYEPYNKVSYPLDSSLELRGIPKLDANNNLYYDGDEYAADGTVTRRYGVVDLGTLTWTQDSDNSSIFYTGPTYLAPKAKFHGNLFCKLYDGLTSGTWRSLANMQMVVDNSVNIPILRIKNNSFSEQTGSDFKAAMSGVMLVYELAEPTTETAESFRSLQSVDDFGTEEFVDTRDVAIPVGHVTQYLPNLRAKLEMSPDSPDGDGDYIVRQTNGQNEYVPLFIPAELPANPSADGTYRLKATVSNGVTTLSWEAAT